MSLDKLQKSIEDNRKSKTLQIKNTQNLKMKDFSFKTETIKQSHNNVK